MQSHRHAVVFPLVIGLLYYLGAWVGVHFAALESGIVILWPPNAVLLAALLSQPPRRWWPLLVVVLASEVAADIPVFTVTQALLFGAINITECLLAASLIRFFLEREVGWHEPKDLSLFLVTVFFIASPIAALGGASVYSFLLTSDTPFLTFWRLWWIGDATGLIILTPLLHMAFSPGLLQRMAGGTWPCRLELAGAWVVSLIACYVIFVLDLHFEKYLALSPLAVVAVPIWVAIRFGTLAGSSLATAVALFVAFATASGLGPFVREQQDHSALLTQEFTVVFIATVLFVAAFVHQNRRKSGELHEALVKVRHLNHELEERVRQRTQELFDTNQQLQTLALTDELTGIPNRRRMKALGEEEAKRSERSERPFSVILLDIDHFKQVNDRYGHAVGDECLKAFVRAIAPSLRSIDRFGRWGGEEFIIVVPDSDHVDLVRLSDKLLRCIRAVVVTVGDDQIDMTVSIGVAEWHHASFDKLVSEADDALYRAKAQGRDRAEINVRGLRVIE
ncbi:sensor domain-containing diguanylate cyclase [Marinobacter sediminum]|uniref:sensor domain-containing diguanylate cyclase n=1 Tax=Marinobacter sediminum TaxID=256323 RepID=UPI00202F7D13|nr:diguanylate cyclase [Marinobacter sediminum]MCM0612976.1 sensor domain-containing diguanylate cyclase [Marinobacter sediminum]